MPERQLGSGRERHPGTLLQPTVCVGEAKIGKFFLIQELRIHTKKIKRSP